MKEKNFIVLRMGRDIDSIIKKEKIFEIKNNFHNKGFIFEKKRMNSIHAKRIYPKYQDYHFYIGGIFYNYVSLLDQNYLFCKNNKVSKLLALFLHLIVDKKSMNGKRKEEFYNNFQRLSNKEKNFFFEICKKEYGDKINNKIKGITQGGEINIRKLKWEIILKKTNLFQIIGLPFVLISNQIYKFNRKRKKYTIAFLGVDGSGKTTNIKNLGNYFNLNDIKYKIGNLGIYHARSFFMNFLSRFVKREKNPKIAAKKLDVNYTKKSPLKNLIRIIDIYIRYNQTLKKAKKKGVKIIIFDRYFYDLILQSKKDFFSRFLLKIVPKPNKVFFLYSNPKELFKRKKERNPKVLKEQIDKFRLEIKGISKIKEIETRTRNQTLKKILIELNNKNFLRCM